MVVRLIHCWVLFVSDCGGDASQFINIVLRNMQDCFPLTLTGFQVGCSSNSVDDDKLVSKPQMNTIE